MSTDFGSLAFFVVPLLETKNTKSHLVRVKRWKLSTKVDPTNKTEQSQSLEKAEGNPLAPEPPRPPTGGTGFTIN